MLYCIVQRKSVLLHTCYSLLELSLGFRESGFCFLVFSISLTLSAGPRATLYITWSLLEILRPHLRPGPYNRHVTRPSSRPFPHYCLGSAAIEASVCLSDDSSTFQVLTISVEGNKFLEQRRVLHSRKNFQQTKLLEPFLLAGQGVVGYQWIESTPEKNRCQRLVRTG